MENKIKTGLPYNLSLMNEIKDKGAIVDMNDLKFPNVDNQIKVAYIFLRNTDLNVDLDFSNCSLEKKTEYLLTYLTTSVEYKIDSLVQTWMAILCFTLGIVLEDKGILNEEELQSFVQNNLAFVGEIIHFLISLPVYSIVRYEFDNKKIDYSSIKENKSQLFNDNINYLLYNNAINIIMNTETIFEPENYIYYFTDTNDKLFTALQELPYTAFLYGLTSKEPDEWNSFIKDYNEIIGNGS